MCLRIWTKHPAICSCSLFCLFGMIGLVVSGIGWSNSTSGIDCNMRARGDLLSESFTAYPEKLLRVTSAYPGFDDVPSAGVCSLDVSLSFGEADYNKSMSTLANSCTDLHDRDDADSVPLCFWNSPSISRMRLARGWQTTSISQQTIKGWKVATVVFGSITGFSVLMVLLLFIIATHRGKSIAWWSRKRTVQPIARPDGLVSSSCSTQP